MRKKRCATFVTGTLNSNVLPLPVMLVHRQGIVVASAAGQVRQHKHELLNWLEGRVAGLTPDWLHIARQVLAGEFDGCDNSTRESLIIGLRSMAHPLARRSLEKL
jgi:hypothetical protein